MFPVAVPPTFAVKSTSFKGAIPKAGEADKVTVNVGVAVTVVVADAVNPSLSTSTLAVYVYVPTEE
ncbi:hypothetical protein HYU89_00660 [Candidatus Collierbacteria bacterium]|nr:hypothetical protein [Candidatus Collierbacteria bacterium]